MQLSERQQLILNNTIAEYIDSALPVSSSLLEEKFGFDVSPATIRNELLKLTIDGFLLQPHTSAGRIPTDKGYRFFVNSILEQKDIKKDAKKIEKTLKGIEKEIKNNLKYVESLTKKLAALSSNLALSYLENSDIFWKEGWKEIFEEPEFKSSDFRDSFIDLVENFGKAASEEFKFEDFSEPRIFIGKENPFSRADDFSLLVSSCSFPEKQKGFLAIIGPKRMDYDKNIGIISEIHSFLSGNFES